MKNEFGLEMPGMARLIPDNPSKPTVHDIAIQAMSGLLACDVDMTENDVAKYSYQIAVEMMRYGMEFDNQASKERAKNA